VESGPAGYRLVVARDEVDALAFERLIGQGRRESSPAAGIEAFAQALALWRGAPLTEVADVPYAQAWIERLQQLRLGAIEDRAAAALSLGRFADLVADLEDVIARNPLRERAHELLMRALTAEGRQGEALAVYERLRRAMGEELGLDPPAALQELQGQVLRDDPALRVSLAPPLPEPTRVARRTNLRLALTSFVGREAELAGITEQVGRTRLVTFVGAGGAGKSRLVSEVAGRLDALGGVWMAELAPVTDPADVISTVLGSIGTVDRSQLDPATVQNAGKGDARTRLLDALVANPTVLILDNCEHLIEAAAELAGFLLSHCPELTVLATSREPLGIVGESIWPVRPLSVQSGTGGDDLDSPAVRLFADRAALVRPGFTVNAENGPMVAGICRRLDGLPLAIELAAARLRTLGLDGLNLRLDNRFRLLTGGNRTAMPRHRTLSAVVAWSWELLTGPERDLIERVAVFAGGVTAETASAVCADAEATAGDFDLDTVADLLISLADKSLLVVLPSGRAGDHEPRYRMLETIREYALERLAQRSLITAMRRAHAHYFLALAELADPHLRRPEQLLWLERLISERDNLLTTMRFAIEAGEADLAVRMASALGWYWSIAGRHEEAANWAEQALRVPGPSSPEPYLVSLILKTVSTAMTGRMLPADHDLDRIEELLGQVDVLAGHPLLTFAEPGLAMLRDDAARGLAAVERNLKHPDPWTRAVLILMTAMLGENEGDYELTKARIPQALAMFTEIGDRWGIGTTSSVMAEILRNEGRFEEAIAMLATARGAMLELRAEDDEAYALVWIARLRIDTGDLAAARRDVETAHEIAAATGSWMSHAFATATEADIDWAEGHHERARQLMEKAVFEGRDAHRAIPQLQATFLANLAVFEAEDGDLGPALIHLREACEMALRSSDMPVNARIAVGVARYAITLGNSGRAVELLGAAAQLRGHDDFRDPGVARVVDLVRPDLEPGHFERLFAQGKALARAKALELIRTTLEGDGPGAPGPQAS
jgi:predicted ATPase